MASSKILALLLVLVTVLVLLPTPAAAFGAGNIASISKIEGHNWRHGDIEDMLKTVAFLRGHKWTSMMVKRVYFGNWLRDYSQAVDVGSLKGIQAGTIRILVWVLSFMSFGYATEEFEVTEERLGVYRPEEHIDNPKDYADNADARLLDPRLRPPVMPIELAIDENTGMKNYIANEYGGWATSTGYIKHSFARSIHFGRVYTSGASGTKGKEADLCEALRCLGQGLHCLEDFGAHTNYTELALRELGFHSVFPHTGAATEINLRGHRVFPLVTGTFGAVDFLHSVLGEATDHFAQTEIDEMDIALGDAQAQSKKSSGSTPGTRGSSGGPAQEASYFTNLLSQIPGGGSLCSQAVALQASSDAQESINMNSQGGYDQYGNSRASAPTFAAPPGTAGGPPGPGIPGMSANFDPVQTVAKIYPILEFRDKVVRAISSVIEKIPGLEALVEKITETLTLFILSLLAPFIRPIIKAVSAQLKQGSSTVVDASGKHQYEVWTDPHCSDPTHSLLSKDHFSNILNGPAGEVASAILQYVAPRIIFAWEHPDVPEHEVLNDVVRVFHHPAIRDPHLELHQKMFGAVERWVKHLPDRGASLNNILSSDGVRSGKNHKGEDNHGFSHGAGAAGGIHGAAIHGSGSHNKVAGSLWDVTKKTKIGKTRDDIGGGGVDDVPGAFPGSDAGYGGQQGGAYGVTYGSGQQAGDSQSYQHPAAPQHYQHDPYASHQQQQGYQDPYSSQQPQYQHGAYPPQGGDPAYAHHQYQHDPNAPPQGGYSEYRGGGYGGGGY
ncbi:MAG: hypothetical protein M1836_007581 [Candelina mexicana]|nr:MAG: hypothetical protein M1836_007581 [Candelina mexicana]